MNVLHVSTPHSWRGGEQQVAYLAIALREAGIRQWILCPDDAVLGNKMDAIGIPIVTFENRGLFDTQLARAISKFALHKKIDLIHCHDSHAHTAAVLATTLFNCVVPLVVSRRVDFPVSSNPLSSWKYNHPAVIRILCVSNAIAQITARSINDKSKLAVVHSGIDSSYYSQSVDKAIFRNELNLPAETRLIGNLSALADHKDYPTFLQTARLLLEQDPTLHFIIAGKGPEESAIKKQIGHLGISSNVHMLGFREEFRPILQSLDIFLITSVTEGLGTIILDSFAAGVPVVATRAGGIPEMVEDGKTGLTVEPRDAQGLANAVLSLLKNESLRKSLMTNASIRVKDFDYRQTALQTLEIYKSVVKI